jgi:adenine/guanine/hypoxanthine permease
LLAIGHVFHGFQFLGIVLVTAIPFGVYDLVEERATPRNLEMM